MLSSSSAIEARHKVLLVDDDAVSLELMALMLTHEGHQVLRATDAGSALQLLAADQATRPDVLLVDLQMPGVSGAQLAEKVRAMAPPRRPLLLAMSATPAKRQQVAAFDGFLLKPLAIQDLRQALTPGKSTRQSKAATAPPSQEPLNMAVVSKLLAMMPAQSLSELITASIADTRASVATIRGQLHNQPAVIQTAHRIKGGAAMIGATRIARLAADLEAGGYKAAATPIILDDLLSGCIELERMLLAGKLKNNQGPRP